MKEKEKCPKKSIWGVSFSFIRIGLLLLLLFFFFLIIIIICGIFFLKVLLLFVETGENVVSVEREREEGI